MTVRELLRRRKIRRFFFVWGIAIGLIGSLLLVMWIGDKAAGSFGSIVGAMIWASGVYAAMTTE